jgi:hypothetical protein
MLYDHIDILTMLSAYLLVFKCLTFRILLSRIISIKFTEKNLLLDKILQELVNFEVN